MRPPKRGWWWWWWWAPNQRLTVASHENLVASSYREALCVAYSGQRQCVAYSGHCASSGSRWCLASSGHDSPLRNGQACHSCDRPLSSQSWGCLASSGHDGWWGCLASSGHDGWARGLASWGRPHDRPLRDGQACHSWYNDLPSWLQQRAAHDAAADHFVTPEVSGVVLGVTNPQSIASPCVSLG